MAKIYTKTGDTGETGLVGGRRVSKGDIRLECYGTVDELNSIIGVARAGLGNSKLDQDYKTELDTTLYILQNELFNLGSRLACADEKLLEKLPAIEETAIARMEADIDQITKVVPPLKNFILPGGALTAAHLQWARTVCRRAERATVKLSKSDPIEPILVKYLNRLSDYLFVLSRDVNYAAGVEEIIWKS